jgi:hypothetical protein
MHIQDRKMIISKPNEQESIREGTNVTSRTEHNPYEEQQDDRCMLPNARCSGVMDQQVIPCIWGSSMDRRVEKKMMAKAEVQAEEESERSASKAG